MANPTCPACCGPLYPSHPSTLFGDYYCLLCPPKVPGRLCYWWRSEVTVPIELLCDTLARVLWLEAPLKRREINRLRNHVRNLLTAESNISAKEKEAERKVIDAAVNEYIVRYGPDGDSRRELAQAKEQLHTAVSVLVTLRNEKNT